MISPAIGQWRKRRIGGQWEKIEETGADWLTFTSGSTVESFHARFDLPALLKKFPRMKVRRLGRKHRKRWRR